MRAIALVDLDDTLFQTRRKCPPDVPPDALVPLGFARDGSPLSYATPRQQSFIAWLSETAWFVPVTARSRDALNRVRIPFTTAICAHGGVIVGEDGEPDPDWSAHIAREAAQHRPALEDLASQVSAAGPGLAVRILTEEGIGLYLLVKDPGQEEAALDAAVDRVAHALPEGWTLHRNGNNAAFMPPFLSKAKAVEALLPRLRARHPRAPVIGIGDSITDAPFMSLCDFAMMPPRSQLGAAALGPYA
jgi:hypothetical protein